MWLVNGSFAFEPSSTLSELTDESGRLISLQFGWDRAFDLIGLSLGGLLAHMTALAARQSGADPRFLILIDPNSPAPCPGMPPQTMVELGYYAFWHLVHQAGLDFLEDEAPEKIALSMAHLLDDEIPAFVVERYMAIAARTGAHMDQQQLILNIQRQMRVKQKMNHLLYDFGLHQKERLPVHTTRSDQPGVVLYLSLHRRLWFGVHDFDAQGEELRVLRDYGPLAAVLVCGDRGHTDQCALAASDRLSIFSDLLAELLLGDSVNMRQANSSRLEGEARGSEAAGYALSPPQLSTAADEVYVQLLSGEITKIESSIAYAQAMSLLCQDESSKQLHPRGIEELTTGVNEAVAEHVSNPMPESPTHSPRPMHLAAVHAALRPCIKQLNTQPSGHPNTQPSPPCIEQPNTRSGHASSGPPCSPQGAQTHTTGRPTLTHDADP